MKLKHLLLTVCFVTLLPLLTFAQSPEEKLKELGLTLPEITSPIANYVKWKQVDNMLYLSGTGPDVYGKVGTDLSVDEGYQAARETGLEIIAVLKLATGGDLSKIKQFVKVMGMVNSAPELFWVFHHFVKQITIFLQKTTSNLKYSRFMMWFF